MSKNTERRIKAIEAMVAPASPQRTIIGIEHPDGTFNCPNGEDPFMLGEDCMVIHVVGVEANEGHGFTEDELEAKYPGRRERLARWNGTRSKVPS